MGNQGWPKPLTSAGQRIPSRRHVPDPSTNAFHGRKKMPLQGESMPSAPMPPSPGSTRRLPLLFRPGAARHQHIRGRDDHRRPERVAIAAERTYVRIRESLTNRAASDVSHSRRSPCFCRYRGSLRLPPPATGCQYRAMVRLPAPGVQFGCFQIAYGGLGCLDGRILGVGTPASQAGGSKVAFDVSVDGFPEQGRQAT